jgi:two-component system nitrate/nitrite response regulator NarL
VLVLTIHDSREYVLEILRSGARGYVLKDASPNELLRAIEVVASGEPFFSPGISEVLLEQCLAETGDARKDPSTLSPRESQVLALVADGKTNRRIADLLGISVRTVESHRAHISRKLGLRSAAELTRLAIQHGLIRTD